MILNANLYTWSYRVAEWAWEAELAQEVADAIMDTSGGEASISETAAEIGGLAAGSVLGALLLALPEPELELGSTSDIAASAGTFEKTVKAPKVWLESDALPDAAAPAAAWVPVLMPAPAPAPAPAPVPTPPAAATADPPRGRWVLKGYRTEIAFSVHTDPNKVDLAFQANEQSGTEIDNKARTRRSPTPTAGAHPWHDRGPEPE